MKSKYDINNESNLAGFVLMLGAMIILLIIFFEYRIGWIGVERPVSEVPYFIYESCDGLQPIRTYRF